MEIEKGEHEHEQEEHEDADSLFVLSCRSKRTGLIPKTIVVLQNLGKTIEEHRVAKDGLPYTKQEFLDYYGAEVGEDLWCASEVDRLIAINAKYQWVSQFQWLNSKTTPQILRSVAFYYWARWTMIAMSMESILNACNDDTDSESDAEHQAPGATSSDMDKQHH